MKALPLTRIFFSIHPRDSFFLTMLIFTAMVFAPGNSLAAARLTLDSTSLADQVSIPAAYTCDGKNISPELEWKNPPAHIQSYVFLLSDPDAPSGTFYHWILYNLPPSLTQLPEGVNHLPKGAMTGTNSFGKNQYNGPCPPRSATHRYVFSLYALNTDLKLPDGASADAVIQAMQNHVLDVAQFKLPFGH